jgi:glycosyltransferase EpsE
MTMARVSVIMSTHNGGKYIANSIVSIINQTFTDWELIICDDCSSDDTNKIISRFSQKDSRIKILTNTTNKKLAFSLNECLAVACGEFIARMDDDDVAQEDRFQKQVAFLDSHKEYDVVGCNLRLFNSNGYQGERLFPEHADLKNNPHRIVQFAHPTIMMRHKIMKELKGYTVAKYTDRGQDFDLWARFFAAGYRGYNLQETLLDYRIADSGYKKTSFRNAFYSLIRHIKCYRLLHFPLYMYIRAFDPIVTFILPAKIMALWHKRRKNNAT